MPTLFLSICDLGQASCSSDPANLLGIFPARYYDVAMGGAVGYGF